MKAAVKSIIKDEKGKVMVLVLILLVVGGLILTPLLGLMSTGLVAGQVYEKKTAELYAADAGVENAIWHLQHGGDPNDTLELTLNGKDVVVQIDKLSTECYEPAIYEIISTAISTDGSSTTVKAHITNITLYYEGDKDLYEGEIIGGNVHVEWNLFLDNDAQIQGNVIAGGDVTMNAASLIGGAICVGGDLTTNDGASIQSDVYVEGNVLLMGGSLSSWIEGDVWTRGTVTVDGESEIHGVVWAGGDTVEVANWAEIIGDVHVRESATVSGNTGTVYRDYNDDWGCPLVFGDPEILSWQIL